MEIESHEVVELYAKCRESAFSRENIAAGFKASGIYPFNLHAVDFRFHYLQNSIGKAAIDALASSETSDLIRQELVDAALGVHEVEIGHTQGEIKIPRRTEICDETSILQSTAPTTPNTASPVAFNALLARIMQEKDP